MNRFLTFIAGPFGTISIYLLIIGIATGGFFGWMAIHDHNIRVEESTKLTLAQLKKTQESLEKFQQSMLKLQEIEKTLDAKFNEQNDRLDTLAGGINENLMNMNIKDSNEQAPEIVKETIRQLRGGK